MNDLQLKKIEKIIEGAVDKATEKYVNGGIRHLTEKVEGIKRDMDQHAKEDREWKEESLKYRQEKLEPIVETSGHATWLTESFKAVLALIILIGGAIAIVSKYI